MDLYTCSLHSSLVSCICGSHRCRISSVGEDYWIVDPIRGRWTNVVGREWKRVITRNWRHCSTVCADGATRVDTVRAVGANTEVEVVVALPVAAVVSVVTPVVVTTVTVLIVVIIGRVIVVDPRILVVVANQLHFPFGGSIDWGLACEKIYNCKWTLQRDCKTYGRVAAQCESQYNHRSEANHCGTLFLAVDLKIAHECCRKTKEGLLAHNLIGR